MSKKEEEKQNEVRTDETVFSTEDLMNLDDLFLAQGGVEGEPIKRPSCGLGCFTGAVNYEQPDRS